MKLAATPAMNRKFSSKPDDSNASLKDIIPGVFSGFNFGPEQGLDSLKNLQLRIKVGHSS